MSERNAEANQAFPIAGTGERAVSRSVRRLFGLSLICLVAAGAIAVVAAYLMPLDELPMEQPAPGPYLKTPQPSELPDPYPTIQLPTLPAEIEAEAVRRELSDLGQRLKTQFPESPEALHVVALLYADLQRTQEAEELWRTCLRLAPDQAGPYLGLATAAMELGKHAEALEILEQAQAAGCSSADLIYHTAEAMSKLGRLEEARTVLAEGATRYPHAAENWLQLGQVQLQLGAAEDAEQSLLRAIAEGTPTDSVYFSLATAYARQGKTDEAAKFREEFARRKAANQQGDAPFQQRYDAELRRIAIAANCRAGSVYEAHGDPRTAQQLLMRALEFGPGNPVVCAELVRLFRDQGKIADAMLVQNRLIQSEPQNVTHYVNLASLAGQMGNRELAESTLRKVITMRPDLAVGYAGLANLYLQRRDFGQARWFAEAALRQDSRPSPQTAQTYAVLAEACRGLGDVAAARAAGDKYLALIGKEPPPDRAGPGVNLPSN